MKKSIKNILASLTRRLVMKKESLNDVDNSFEEFCNSDYELENRKHCYALKIT